MNEKEKFLDRWSRRKREAAEPQAPAEAKAPAHPPRPVAKKPPEAPFDPTSLPPIESITAQSDIHAFLQPGVPPELTRAALRRAWSADPAIRDFIGLVENGWDFNDPHGVPGFGPLPAGEDIGQLLAQAVGAPPLDASSAPQQKVRAHGNDVPTDEEKVATAGAVGESLPSPEQVQPTTAAENPPLQRNTEDHALQKKLEGDENAPTSRRHMHGSALPK